MKTSTKRVVLITGGSSGIGLEMAKQMLAEDSRVIICGRSQEKLDSAKRKNPQLITFQCDITKAEDRKSLYDFIKTKYYQLNMLMNNAGIVRRFLFTKTNQLEKNILDEWQTNYFAPLLLTRLFLPLLIKNQGTVVNVTSGLAYVPAYIQPNYCATKAALHSMTQSIRLELAKTQVKVVEIFYPAVDTPFQQGHSPAHAIQPELAAAIALKNLNKGKKEIQVKMANSLYLLNRFFPKKALKIINGFIPDNIEKLLN